MMREIEFDASVKRTVGPALALHKMSSEGGRGCTFYRQIASDLFHFVSFDLRSGGADFEVMVYPGTPLLGAEQWKLFPDFVGIPTGRRAGLNAKLGVGVEPSRFSCRDARALDVVLSRVVLPALEKFGLPYLDRFKSVQDIVPVLEHSQWAKLPTP